MAKNLTLTWNGCILKVKDSLTNVNYGIFPVAYQANKKNQSVTLTAKGGLKKIIYVDETIYANLADLVNFIDSNMCNT